MTPVSSDLSANVYKNFDNTFCIFTHLCLILNGPPYELFNTLLPRDACVRQWNRPLLVPIMACRLSGTKPLLEPMLVYCQLEPYEHTTGKTFTSKKMHLKKTTLEPHFNGLELLLGMYFGKISYMNFISISCMIHVKRGNELTPYEICFMVSSSIRYISGTAAYHFMQIVNVRTLHK